MLVYLLFMAGLAGLVIGGDALVRGSVGLAEKLGIPALIIGLTIVAFGTSAPELVISLDAALIGSGELAVGNVVGSNIANVLLVLGVPALFAPLVSRETDVRQTVFFLVGVTILFMVQMSVAGISRFDGMFLLICLAAFLLQQFLSARRQQKTLFEAAGEEEAAEYLEDVGTVPHNWLAICGLVLLGIILLPLGAKFTVDSAVEIAERWAVPKDIIGLTIVAIGTSLPELATGIMAARQGSSSVALGNVIGSNFFNIAAIMGITASVVPLPVSAHIIHFDMWVMLAVTIFLIAIAMFRVSIGRWIGLTMAGLYVAYLVWTVMT